MEIEIKRLEMEMNQKQFQFKQQLELAKLNADRDISRAKEKAELAELEDLSPSRALNAVRMTPEITSSFVVPAVSTQASTFPTTPRRVYTFPAAHGRAHADP